MRLRVLLWTKVTCPPARWTSHCVSEQPAGKVSEKCSCLACKPFWGPLQDVLFCPAVCLTLMTVIVIALPKWHLQRDSTFRNMSDFCSTSVPGLFSVPAFLCMLPLQLLPDDFSWILFATCSCGSYSVSTLQMSWLPPASSLPLSEDEDMDWSMISYFWVFSLQCTLSAIKM